LEQARNKVDYNSGAKLHEHTFAPGFMWCRPPWLLCPLVVCSLQTALFMFDDVSIVVLKCFCCSSILAFTWKLANWCDCFCVLILLWLLLVQ